MVDEVNRGTTIPNNRVLANHSDDAVTHVQTREISRRDERRLQRDQGLRSRRDVLVNQSINFCLYGITLLIPGVAMIIVYFVIFRLPSGDVKWSPAEAFVIVGAVLVGFSIVSEVVGLWQFWKSRHESDEVDLSTTRNNPYSDSPPSYDRIANTHLPDVVVPSISQNGNTDYLPTFESCYPNQLSLPGLENSAFDNASESEDFPPPPPYKEELSRKGSNESSQTDADIILNCETGSARVVNKPLPEKM